MPTPRLSPGAHLSIMRPLAPAAPPRTAGDGRVTIIPSPNGLVHLLAKTVDGKWAGEHICFEDEVDEKLIRAMELRAKKREQKAIAIVK